MLKKHLYIFAAVLCLAIIASGAGLYASGSQIGLPPSTSQSSSVASVPSTDPSSDFPQSSTGSTETASDRPISSSSAPASSQAASNASTPAQDPKAVINVPEGQTLVLGEGGKFILRTDEGNIPLVPPEIPAEEWENFLGYYDTGTKVVLDGEVAYLRSVVPATIDSVSGAACKLGIVGGSNITVSSGTAVGIDVIDLTISAPEGTLPTTLAVSATDVGIRFSARIMAGAFTTLNVSGVSFGAQYVGEDYTMSSDSFVVYHTSNVTVTAIGAEGIGIKADGIRLEGATLTVSAPNGVGGIKVFTDFSMSYSEGRQSIVKATSATGRAISCKSMGVYGSQVSGITPGGSMGIHANDYLNISQGLEGSPPSKIFGSANVGYGIVAQNIDSGNGEYPSGSINVQDGKIEGRTNEGMGISTNTFSVYGDGNFVPEVVGIAQAGIGISVCMFTTNGNTSIRGESYGATKKHYQVYGAIADSVGINVLSYFNVYGNATIVATAPKDVPGSFGLHCLLVYEQGGVSGYIGLYGDTTDRIDFTASGETGIYAVNMSCGVRGTINAIGSKNGIVVNYFYTYGNPDMDRLKINATGTSGIGLKLQREWEYANTEFKLERVELEAVGGEFGIFVAGDAEMLISNSIVNARAEGPLAVAGAYIYATQDLEQVVRKIVVMNSSLYATSPNYGWLFKDIELEVSAPEYTIALPAQMKGEGRESGIKLDFSPVFMPEYQAGTKTALYMHSILLLDGNTYTVWGVSHTVPPDERGRSSAISTPSCTVAGGGVLYEEYMVIATGQLTEAEPYPAYASGMNIKDYERYMWMSPENPIRALDGGLVADGNGTFYAEVTGERTMVGTRADGVDITIEDGTHRVRFVTDISIGMVRFNANGGTPDITTIGVPMGREIPDPPIVTRPGFEFSLWKNVDTGDTWYPGMLLLGKDQIEFEAVWITILYKVGFDANAGGDPVENMPSGTLLELPAGDMVPAPSNAPQRAGHEFKYWALEASGSTAWKFDSDVMPLNDITLYAVWGNKEYTITFSAVGGAPQAQTENVAFGSIPQMNIQSPTREGFAFTGWFTDVEATVAWDSSAAMPAQDFTVYAGWSNSYVTISFDLNGGDEQSAIGSIKVGIGTEADLGTYQPGADSAPYFDGYFFMGWVDDSGNVAQDKYLVPEHDIHLKAQWQKAEIELPKDIVAYRNTKTEEQIENSLGFDVEYEDLLHRTHKILALPEWDSSILSKGGIGNMGVRFVNAESGSLICYENMKIYVLNHAVITSQEKQTFALGQGVSLDGSEWSPVCYAEMPDFETQTIKQVPVPLTFLMRGTNIRVAGTYYPEFNGVYTDYFGAVKNINRLVVAIVLPEGGGAVGPTLKYWQTVANKMLDTSSPKQMFISATNYGYGGDAIMFAPNHFAKRILARPGWHTMMTAEALQALKNTPNAQLQVDLGWLQWYMNTTDFENGVDPSGTYQLDVQQQSSEPWLKDFATGRNAMLLQFAMNKQWNGTPTMQVQVNSDLQKSAADGKDLYMFWFNSRSMRLELIGRMDKDSSSKFSIRMNAVNQHYIILDELPIGDNNKPDFVISDKTNAMDDDLRKAIEDLMTPKEITDIQVGVPQALVEEKTPMISMLFPSILCLIIIILLLLVIAFLLYRNHRLRKQLRKELPEDMDGDVNNLRPKAKDDLEYGPEGSFARDASMLEERMFGNEVPEGAADAMRAIQKEKRIFNNDVD